MKETEFKIKLCKGGKYIENLSIVCYYVVFICLMTREGATAARRHYIINAAGLIQHIYFENALTEKNILAKNMSLWRKCFAFFPMEMRDCGFIMN